jgi:ATP-dependent helicase/nuclease subunit B
LDLAKTWASQYPADAELLVLAGTSIAANAFHLGRIDSNEASFGTRRLTIAALVSQLARRRLAEAGRATGSALSFTAIIARVIHLLITEGRLDYFLPVATKPGFPRALTRTLNELRMNDIEPEALSHLGTTVKDLAVITRAVDDELASRKIADRAVVYQETIASLKVDENEGYAGLPLLLLDLPIHSVLEVRLIRELVRRSPEMLAVLPVGDNRTISSLEDILECQRSVLRAQGPTTSLSLAKEHLFQDTSPAPSTLDESMILSSWPGESRECVEIVRSIQQEAENNVAFDHMAVFLNASSTYRPHLEEAFDRAEIPVFFAEGATSLDPSGRAMMALLSCAAQGISASLFAEYLSLGQVPIHGPADSSAWAPPRDELLTREQDNHLVPDAIAGRQPHLDSANQPNSEPEVLHAPWRWESLLVDAAVIGGKQRWQRRLTGLENEC